MHFETWTCNFPNFFFKRSAFFCETKIFNDLKWLLKVIYVLAAVVVYRHVYSFVAY
jgi:hypothetical protein